MERHKPESRRPYCSTIHTYLTEPLLRCGDAFERGSELTEKPKCAGRHLTHTFCMCQLTDRHAQSKLSTAFVANSLGSCFTSIRKKDLQYESKALDVRIKQDFCLHENGTRRKTSGYSGVDSRHRLVRVRHGVFGVIS